MWANIVTVNDGTIAYWVYIPRYEYNPTGDHSEIKFIPYTTTEADDGYEIPEAFTFEDKDGNPVQLKGYWVSKHEVQ